MGSFKESLGTVICLTRWLSGMLSTETLDLRQIKGFGSCKSLEKWMDLSTGFSCLDHERMSSGAAMGVKSDFKLASYRILAETKIFVTGVQIYVECDYNRAIPPQSRSR